MEVFYGDDSQDLVGDFFQPLYQSSTLLPLQIFHLRPQIFNEVKVGGIERQHVGVVYIKTIERKSIK